MELGVRLGETLRKQGGLATPKGGEKPDRTAGTAEKTGPCEGLLGCPELPEIRIFLPRDPPLIHVTGRLAATARETDHEAAGGRRKLLYAVDKVAVGNLAEIVPRVRETIRRYRNEGRKAVSLSIVVDPGILVKELVPLLDTIRKTRLRKVGWGVLGAAKPNEEVRNLSRLPAPRKMPVTPRSGGQGSGSKAR